MKSNTLVCNLSFYGLHSITQGIGVMDIRIKHRYRLVVSSKQGTEMVAEDVVSPEMARVFAVPVQVFHLPQLRQLYVSNVLANLKLGSPIFKYVTSRTTSFVHEVVERSGGDGFWMVVEVDVWAVDKEDGVDLNAYGWRKMESGDEDDDRLAVDEGLMNIGEDDGGEHEDGDDSGDGNEELTIDDCGECGGEDADHDEDEPTVMKD